MSPWEQMQKDIHDLQQKVDILTKLVGVLIGEEEIELIEVDEIYVSGVPYSVSKDDLDS